jgi:hypothetical protein
LDSVGAAERHLSPSSSILVAPARPSAASSSINFIRTARSGTPDRKSELLQERKCIIIHQNKEDFFTNFFYFCGLYKGEKIL